MRREGRRENGLQGQILAAVDTITATDVEGWFRFSGYMD